MNVWHAIILGVTVGIVVGSIEHIARRGVASPSPRVDMVFESGECRIFRIEEASRPYFVTACGKAAQ